VSLDPGQLLGPYEIQALVGVGGMGEVYRGRDTRLNRTVALKVVSPQLASQEHFRERFDREALTISQLNHPNVCTLFDVGHHEGVDFLVMEFVDGETLAERLTRGPLSPAESLDVALQIAHGLAHAHVHGIVHRDVKPANVLLGRDETIKVTDFGIADFVAAASRAEGLVFGTPGYLPPESLRGAGHTRSGDLFALGVILYECLTGAKPFGGLQVADMIQSTLFGVLRPPGARTAGIPPDLESLVLLLLERDPARRPTNAAAVAEELDHIAARHGYRWQLDEALPAAVAAEVVQPSLTVEAQWVPTARVEVG
jgi:serine/threonine-protein kinase